MFESMKTFSIWILTKLPDFLMSEPICYFIAIFILIGILKVIFTIVDHN